MWHAVEGLDAAAPVGDHVHGAIDWERRHPDAHPHRPARAVRGDLERVAGCRSPAGTWSRCRPGWTSSSTRCPRASAPVEELVNAELAADRPIEVSFLPRDAAVEDEDLIRTKVNMIPESVARSGSSTSSASTSRPTAAPTSASTGEVGRIRVVKTESKGKGNKRIRLEVRSADVLAHSTRCAAAATPRRPRRRLLRRRRLGVPGRRGPPGAGPRRGDGGHRRLAVPGRRRAQRLPPSLAAEWGLRGRRWTPTSWTPPPTPSTTATGATGARTP